MSYFYNLHACRWSKWPRGLRPSSAATCLLRLWVRVSPGTWVSICCECCVFSGRGLCDELISGPDEPYRLWCVVVCDLETSWMRRPWPTGGLSLQKQTNKQTRMPRPYAQLLLNKWILNCADITVMLQNPGMLFVGIQHIINYFFRLCVLPPNINWKQMSRMW